MMLTSRPTDNEITGLALFICEEVGGYLWHNELPVLQSHYKNEARRIVNEHFASTFKETLGNQK